MKALGLLFCLAIAVGTPSSARSDDRPNVLWLSVEDMSPWIACYGDATVPTPNLDRLAAGSVRFVNAFASSPVCAPARSSLITGMYATRIGTSPRSETGNSWYLAVDVRFGFTTDLLCRLNKCPLR